MIGSIDAALFIGRLPRIVWLGKDCADISPNDRMQRWKCSKEGELQTGAEKVAAGGQRGGDSSGHKVPDGCSRSI
jgi:hypothetical protein